MKNAEFLTRKKKENFPDRSKGKQKTVETMCFVRSHNISLEFIGYLDQ
jgi:hypothetical protein